MKFIQYHKKKGIVPPPLSDEIRFGFSTTFYSPYASDYFGINVDVSNSNGNFTGVFSSNDYAMPTWGNTGLNTGVSNTITVDIVPTYIYSLSVDTYLSGFCTMAYWDGFNWICCITEDRYCTRINNQEISTVTIYTYDNTLSPVNTYFIPVASLPYIFVTGINEVYYLVDLTFQNYGYIFCSPC